MRATPAVTMQELHPLRGRLKPEKYRYVDRYERGVCPPKKILVLYGQNPAIWELLIQYLERNVVLKKVVFSSTFRGKKVELKAYCRHSSISVWDG